MLVKDRMTANPIVGHPGMSVTDAQMLMREKRIRHLPVLGEDGGLVGLVTQRSLSSALPSDVSNFSRFEITYVLGRITLGKVMVKDVTTIDEETAVEEAARVMADQKIGCLPVVRDGRLVGIITDNDLFTIMVDLLGARRPGVRLTLLQPDRPGEIARLSTAVAKTGGNLTVIVGWPSAEPARWISVIKVTNLDAEKLTAIIDSLKDVEILDIREV
jgi:acetoin utilization protein AcuB